VKIHNGVLVLIPEPVMERKTWDPKVNSARVC
jgi:hypothetical protein